MLTFTFTLVLPFRLRLSPLFVAFVAFCKISDDSCLQLFGRGFPLSALWSIAPLWLNWSALGAFAAKTAAGAANDGYRR